jgi:hypothetical protein
MRAGPGAFDYRIAVNPEISASGIEYMRTVLLETGRAVHYYGLDRLETRGAFKWDSDCVRNAVAMLFASAASEEKWLRDIAGLDAREAKTLSAMMEYNSIHMGRRLAADALFEMSLYFGDEPSNSYRAIQELFHGGPIDHQIERAWAWHPYLALNPGGQMSYMLGYLLYELMRKDMLQRYGTLLHPDAAAHIIDTYFTGHETGWPRRFGSIAIRDLASGKRGGN